MAESARGEVLVLGSGGFIGSAITEFLARSGRRVLALGRSEATVKGSTVVRIRGSIEDTVLLRETIAACDQIVYCASVTTPGTSASDPALEVLGNLLPLARVLECAHMCSGRRLIYMSSGGAVYGDLARGAVEATPLSPRSYYGAGKSAAEALIHACTVSTDWQATVLRPSNAYGPGQDLVKGFAIVPTLFARALDSTPFQIWGDGSTARDYCYIDDLTAAVGAVLGTAQSAPLETYNVASGLSVSILDLVAKCEAASGRRIQLDFQPARGVDVPHVSPSSAAIRSALGWVPAVSLEEGLQRTWHWTLHSLQAESGAVSRADAVVL